MVEKEIFESQSKYMRDSVEKEPYSYFLTHSTNTYTHTRVRLHQ